MFLHSAPLPLHLSFAIHPSSQDLPKPVIPDLERTLQRYLDGLRAVIPASQFDQTKRTVDHFARTTGPKLQQELIAFAEESENWVSEWQFARRQATANRHTTKCPSFRG